MRNILVFGAAHPLAAALAAECAAHGYGLVLTDAQESAAARLAADLTERYGIRAQSVPFDVSEFPTAGDWFIRCLPLGPARLEGVLLCTVPEPDRAAVTAILARAADYLEDQAGGFLAGPAAQITALPAQPRRSPVHRTVIRQAEQHDPDHRDPGLTARAIYRALTRGRGFIAVGDAGRAVAAAARHLPGSQRRAAGRRGVPTA